MNFEIKFFVVGDFAPTTKGYYFLGEVFKLFKLIPQAPLCVRQAVI